MGAFSQCPLRDPGVLRVTGVLGKVSAIEFTPLVLDLQHETVPSLSLSHILTFFFSLPFFFSFLFICFCLPLSIHQFLDIPFYCFLYSLSLFLFLSLSLCFLLFFTKKVEEAKKAVPTLCVVLRNPMNNMYHFMRSLGMSLLLILCDV